MIKRVTEEQPEKKDITYRGTKIRMIADFSSETIQAKKAIE